MLDHGILKGYKVLYFFSKLCPPTSSRAGMISM